jgi:hypothetical protein
VGQHSPPQGGLIHLGWVIDDPGALPGAASDQPLAGQLLVGVLDGADGTAPGFGALPDGGQPLSRLALPAEDLLADGLCNFAVQVRLIHTWSILLYAGFGK